jgi:class 3 adenylate cyclase
LRAIIAERRQVTVLFTDMVGFTTFSERSGEEAAFTLMRSLAKLMDEAVREQGGVVQSHLNWHKVRRTPEQTRCLVDRPATAGKSPISPGMVLMILSARALRVLAAGISM